MRVRIVGIFVAAGITGGLHAQWLNYPEPGTPLTRDGKPDLKAKTPRASDGKPDLSGVWQIAPPPPGEFEQSFGPVGVGDVLGDDARDQSKYFFDLFVDFKGQDSPLRPEAAARTAKNLTTLGDSPSAHCLPYSVPNRYLNARPFKMIQTPRVMIQYFEIDGAFRQIHTDGRKLPVDPFPAWIGYSVGRWDGDTLVVESSGYNSKTWLDVRGHEHSEALRVTERFHRRNFGAMDIEATVDDPAVLTKPVTIKFTVLLIPNSDVLENFCAEGERDFAVMPKSKN
jgi:hypothetical protein